MEDLVGSVVKIITIKRDEDGMPILVTDEGNIPLYSDTILHLKIEGLIRREISKDCIHREYMFMER